MKLSWAPNNQLYVVKCPRVYVGTSWTVFLRLFSGFIMVISIHSYSISTCLTMTIGIPSSLDRLVLEIVRLSNLIKANKGLTDV